MVVPTRNRRVLLARALAGVAAQRFRDLEVVVVDDGSDDGTPAWVRAHHPTVRLVELGRRLGAAAARNRGVEHARGELVAFLDDDDAWWPGYLAAQVERLDASAGAVLSFADHVEVDIAGKRTRPDTEPVLAAASPLVRLLAESYIHTMSVVVVRRDAFERFGALDERLAIVHDLDWYARVLAAGSMVRCRGVQAERHVPGGLVTAHREWFHEEQRVIRNALRRAAASREDERLVRACRALFFARLALARGDIGFSIARLCDALESAPSEALRIAALRLGRRLDRGRARVEPDWAAPAEVAA